MQPHSTLRSLTDSCEAAHMSSIWHPGAAAPPAAAHSLPPSPCPLFLLICHCTHKNDSMEEMHLKWRAVEELSLLIYALSLSQAVSAG